MAVLKEPVDTALGIEDAFAFIADFSNAANGIRGGQSAQVGAARLAVGALPARGPAGREREADGLHDHPTGCAASRGAARRGLRDLRRRRHPVRGRGTGATILYTADIRLRGVLRFLRPFAGARSASARDAAMACTSKSVPPLDTARATA